MKGSLDKACVLYAPVEEIGSEGCLLRACRIHICYVFGRWWSLIEDAFLVL